LDAGTLRQKVTANNIANVNTPYFKKSTVAFDSLLRQALSEDPAPMRTTHQRHFGAKSGLESLRPEAVQVQGTLMRTDLNNVDIDEEMTNLAANSIMYNTLTQILSSRYSGLTTVISGGKR
jgi:flagellar basal-body rod protein FlgB